MGEFGVYQACRACPLRKPSREFLVAPMELISGNGR